MLLSSLPLSATMNAGAFCSTVVIGLVGGVMVGGLLITTALTVMFTGLVTVGLTLSVSVAVKVAVPVKLGASVTVYVMFAVPWPPATVTLCTPVPAVAPQLKMLLSSLPERLTLNGAALNSTVVIGLPGALITGGLFTIVQGGTVVAELRGAAVVTRKSLALLSVP